MTGHRIAPAPEPRGVRAADLRMIPRRATQRALPLCLLFGLACTTSATGGESSDEASQGSSAESASSTGSGSCEPTLESVRDDIFVPRCGVEGCHGGSSPSAGLRLDAEADLLAELVSVGAGTCDGWVRVVPGAPEASFLSHKLSQTAPECGDPMPPGPNGLSAQEIECVDQWIAGIEGGGCETCGGDACVDLQTDPLHCGACDSPCPTGVACVEGGCDCGEGNLACDDVCANPLSDPNHCGGCGVECAANEVCFAGICADDCGALTQCGQSCVNLQSDPLHCGECDLACDAGQACTAGQCACGGDPVSFAAQVEPLLDARCSGNGCHSAPAPKEGLNLSAGQSYGSLVEVEANQCNNGSVLVVPGSVGSSYLINKLRGVDLCKGSIMPKADTALPATDIEMIEAWICQGAQNN